MSVFSDRVGADSATAKILAAVRDQRNFVDGQMKPEAYAALIHSIAEAGFSKQELNEAKQLQTQLKDTPSGELITKIAEDVLQGFEKQGRLGKLVASIRDPVHSTAPSKDWINHLPPAPSESVISGWADRIVKGMKLLAGTVLNGEIHRGFHAKTAFAEPATLTIYGDSPLPPDAQKGLFAPNAEDPSKSVKLKAVARGSNGIGCPFFKAAGDLVKRVVPDKAPDVHGLAVLTEREGKQSNITSTDQTHGQHVHTGEQFVDFGEGQQLANAKGHLGLLGSVDSASAILKAFGPIEGPKVLARITRDTGLPKDSLATSQFVGSIVRLGDFSGKIHFVPDPNAPAGTQGGVGKDDPDYHHKDSEARGSKRWIMCVQMYVDPKATPLDDATVPWQSPLIPVGELVTHPSRDPNQRKAEEAAITQMSFNPGIFDSGPPPEGRPELAAPLLDTMGQPRHKIYDESAKARKAWSPASALEWLKNVGMDGRL